MTKATLQIRNEWAKFEYDNVWNTKCSIFDLSGLKIKYSGFANSGTINSNTEDPSLLLSGLYITNYYRQIYIAIIIASQIPIWIALIK